VFAEKKKLDFAPLTFYSNVRWNVSRQFFITCACSTDAFAKSIPSSAKRMLEILGPLRLVGNRRHLPCRTSLSINWDNLSIQAMKRYEDSGSPYRISLIGLKLSVSSPFHSILGE